MERQRHPSATAPTFTRINGQGWRSRRSRSRWAHERAQADARDRRGRLRKRFATKEIKAKRRGAIGVKVGEPPLVAALMADSDELIVATRQGQIIRLAASDVPIYHREARGVRVVRLRDGDQVAAAAIAQEGPQ